MGVVVYHQGFIAESLEHVTSTAEGSEGLVGSIDLTASLRGMVAAMDASPQSLAADLLTKIYQ